MNNELNPHNKINQPNNQKTKTKNTRNSISEFYSLTPHISINDITQNENLKHSHTKNIVSIDTLPTTLEENTICRFEKYKKHLPDDDSQDIVEYDEDFSADDDSFFDKIYSLGKAYTVIKKTMQDNCCNKNSNNEIKRKLFNVNKNNNSYVQRICTLQFEANEKDKNNKNEKLKKTKINDKESKNVKKENETKHQNNKTFKEIIEKSKDKNKLKDALKLSGFNEKTKDEAKEKDKKFNKKNSFKGNKNNYVNYIRKEVNEAKSNSKEKYKTISNMINYNSMNNNIKNITNNNTNINYKTLKLSPRETNKFSSDVKNSAKNDNNRNNLVTKLSKKETSPFNNINSNYYFYKNQKENTCHLFVRHLSNKPKQIYIKRKRNNNIFPSLKEKMYRTLKEDEQDHNTNRYNNFLHNEVFSPNKTIKNNHITYVIKTSIKKDKNQHKKNDNTSRISNTPNKIVLNYNKCEDQRNSNHNIFFVNTSSNNKENEKKLFLNKVNRDNDLKKNRVYKGNICDVKKESRNKNQNIEGLQNYSLSERKIETIRSKKKNKTKIINLKNNRDIILGNENLVTKK